MKEKRKTISEKQKSRLGAMIGGGLEGINNFVSDGDPEQAADLAEVFRFASMFILNSSYLETERESFRMEIEHLKKKYDRHGFRSNYTDYLDELDVILPAISRS